LDFFLEILFFGFGVHVVHLDLHVVEHVEQPNPLNVVPVCHLFGFGILAIGASHYATS
jgi:hypothetical protein